MIVSVTDHSVVSDARRRATDLARKLGFDEAETGRVALVATELAGNLIKHAGYGDLIVSTFDDCQGRGVEILSLDVGPGIADVTASIRDGYSTAGSAGTGLGAVRRLSDVFAVNSQSGIGTAVLSRIAVTDASDAGRSHLIGVVSEPCIGETACGDAWAILRLKDRTLVLVADGTGHGPEAAKAAIRSVQIFNGRVTEPIDVILREIHQGLIDTRGAAVAVAEIDSDSGQILYAGIGNIMGAVIDGGNAKRMVSHNGIAGHALPRIQAFPYPSPPTATTLLHSDGLTSRWSLGKYPGLAAAHPSLIAGILFRDFRRGRDDATIVVVRRENA